jgi:DNA-binding response OmpR family regulator
VEGREIGLTYQEFELLVHFTRHPWQVFSRAELMQALWPAVDAATRTVDVHVHRLRRKLGSVGSQLATVRRVGYTYRPHLANRSRLTPAGE